MGRVQEDVKSKVVLESYGKDGQPKEAVIMIQVFDLVGGRVSRSLEM